MIINAKTPNGANAIIYDKDDNRVILPIKSYNTETKELEYYLLNKDGSFKMTEWKTGTNKKGMPKGDRKAIVEKKTIEGSYAMVSGKRVE